MEYERQRQRQSPNPQRQSNRELQRIALEKIDEALKAVHQYREATNLDYKMLLEDGDELLKARASKLLRESLFVGAAGEVCDECGGSGRKR